MSAPPTKCMNVGLNINAFFNVKVSTICLLNDRAHFPLFQLRVKLHQKNKIIDIKVYSL